MLIKDKMQLKFDRIRQQFGCGYYSVCCRNKCPCSLKYQEYDMEKMKMLKKEFDQETVELFGR